MSRRGLPGIWMRRLAAGATVRYATALGRPEQDGPERRATQREAGMTTAEYAVGTLAACAFAALLIAVVRSPEIRAALAGLIMNALDLGK